jgi:hypothetical protein
MARYPVVSIAVPAAFVLLTLPILFLKPDLPLARQQVQCVDLGLWKGPGINATSCPIVNVEHASITFWNEPELSETSELVLTGLIKKYSLTLLKDEEATLELDATVTLFDKASNKPVEKFTIRSDKEDRKVGFPPVPDSYFTLRDPEKRRIDTSEQIEVMRVPYDPAVYYEVRIHALRIISGYKENSYYVDFYQEGLYLFNLMLSGTNVDRYSRRLFAEQACFFAVLLLTVVYLALWCWKHQGADFKPWFVVALHACALVYTENWSHYFGDYHDQVQYKYLVMHCGLLSMTSYYIAYIQTVDHRRFANMLFWALTLLDVIMLGARNVSIQDTLHDTRRGYRPQYQSWSGDSNSNLAQVLYTIKSIILLLCLARSFCFPRRLPEYYRHKLSLHLILILIGYTSMNKSFPLKAAEQNTAKLILEYVYVPLYLVIFQHLSFGSTTDYSQLPTSPKQDALWKKAVRIITH